MLKTKKKRRGGALNGTCNQEELYMQSTNLSYLFANRMNDTRNFRYLSWDGLKNLAVHPYSCEKCNTPILGMHNAKAKTKAEVRAHDTMNLLWLDIDKTDYTLEDVKAGIKEHGIESFIIYSTISATPDTPKWRVFIELASSLCCDKWITVQEWLVDVFDGDSCATGIQQIAFLPNIFSGYYEYFINDGPAFDPSVLNLPVHAPVHAPVPQPRLTVIDSPIVAYNKNNDVSNLLTRYGFKQRGKKWVYPGSQSGLPGVKILDGKYYSHHSNDPLSDGLAHDAFDLFVEYEHQGNKNAALKAAAKAYVDVEPQVPFWLAGAGTIPGTINGPEPDATRAVPEPVPPVITAGCFETTPVDMDYLLEGILLKGYLYTFTGPTGTGKTAIAMLLAASVALGREFAGLDVIKGRVLYLAGENPVDIQLRLKGLCQEMGVTSDELSENLHFVSGVESLNLLRGHVRNNRYSLVIVDTLSAHFTGDDSNSNDQVKAFAQDQLRSLTDMQARPVILALSHPVKSPVKDNCVPYGGGALLNEVDGNLALWGTGDEPRELYTCGKFRGIPFDSLNFKMKVVDLLTVKTRKGKPVPTVFASYIDEEEAEKMAKKVQMEERDLLSSMIHYPRLSLYKRAAHLKWIQPHSGKPAKSKVQKMMERLRKFKYVGVNSSSYYLTKIGRERAHGIAENEAY